VLLKRGKLARNPNREKYESLILEAVSAFWLAYLKDDEKAKAWLQEHYV